MRGISKLMKSLKVMKAPEKIYLQEPTKVRTEKSFDNDVEYVRTDAFIEKAVSYIQQHWIWNTKMIEDFKKYMEGE